MKRVLIVNTSERTGGAAIAASRLLSALNKNGFIAEMLVRDKQTSNKAVNSIGKKWRMAGRWPGKTKGATFSWLPMRSCS